MLADMRSGGEPRTKPSIASVPSRSPQEQMPAGGIDMGSEQVTNRLIVVLGAAVEPDRRVRAGDGLLDMLPPAYSQVGRPGVRELLGSREGEDAWHLVVAGHRFT